MTRDKGGRENRSSRRSILKAAGLTAAAGLASMPALGRTRIEPVALDPQKAEPSAPRIETATEVKRVSSNYMLLVLNESSVRHYIDNSDATREEKRKAHENLGDLKRAFPLRTVKDGEVTRYELAEGAKNHPNEAETEKFQQLARVFGDGASGGGGGVSIQHHQSVHRTMTKSAGDEMGLSSEVVYTAKEAADDPDDPNVSIDVPDVVPHDSYIENGLEDFIADVIHHVGQYFNPDPGWSYSFLCDHNSTYHEEDDEVSGIGGAPYATEYHFDKADNATGESEETWAGRLTHFPQDMGQPLHTGMAWQQANLDIKYNWTYGYFYVTVDPMYWLHYGYEDFVKDYWDNSYHEFHNAFDDGDDCSGSCYKYYETYGDGYRLVDYLADFSHQYSETVYKEILEEDGTRDPSKWDFSTRDALSQLTRDCLHQTGRWTRGCLHRYFVN